jgi:hypothetical protein
MDCLAFFIHTLYPHPVEKVEYLPDIEKLGMEKEGLWQKQTVFLYIAFLFPYILTFGTGKGKRDRT